MCRGKPSVFHRQPLPTLPSPAGFRKVSAARPIVGSYQQVGLRTTTSVGNSADSRGVAQCRATVCCTPPNDGHQARWAAERSAVTCMHGLGRMLAIITFVVIKNTLDDLIFRLLWVLSSIRFNQPFPNPSITNPYFEFFIVPLNLIRKR